MATTYLALGLLLLVVELLIGHDPFLPIMYISFGIVSLAVVLVRARHVPRK